ncbi:hypothetical protein HanXRQr2_Chr10g0445411 [Helianthus annuus]|uniref:Uncharacterized protein n=1 Tax=Helianthus annuus TaxID=4232 RepID=A0A9K3N4L2_HELAN|nr:hypothetical protein HanXRQr2_Chr10g0445411 [Helianthus annuus]
MEVTSESGRLNRWCFVFRQLHEMKMVVTTVAASPPSAAVDDGGRSGGSRLGLFRSSPHRSNWCSLCSGYVDLFRPRGDLGVPSS